MVMMTNWRRVIMTVVVMVVLIWSGGGGGVAGDSIYACWGGCYNECFLLRGSSGGGSYPCYLGCLNKCTPRSAADYQYYCRLGCSVELCDPLSFDGLSMDGCFNNCGQVCNV